MAQKKISVLPKKEIQQLRCWLENSLHTSYKSSKLDFSSKRNPKEKAKSDEYVILWFCLIYDEENLQKNPEPCPVLCTWNVPSLIPGDVENIILRERL